MHALKLVENLDENWADAQSARAETISSYEIAIIAGLDKYTSALKLWAIKTGKIPPPPQSIQMWLAYKMQKVMVSLYSRETGSRTIEPNTLFVHPTISFAAAKPSALIANSDKIEDALGIVKVAKVHERTMREWNDETEEVPFKHLIRAQWELGIFGLDCCDYGVLSSADEFKVRQVEFSQEVWERALELAEGFLKAVKEDVPPDAGPGDRRLIEQIVGQRNEIPVDLTGDEDVSTALDHIARIGDRRRAMNREVKELEAQEKGFENRVIQKMGKSSVANAKKLGGSPVFLRIKKTVVEPFQNKGSSYVQLKIK